MNWLVGIGLFVLVGVCSFQGIERYLEGKANKLSRGNEEDRRDAAEERDIASKIDHGKYYPLL